MPAYIHKLRTITPQHCYQQDEIRESLKRWAKDPKTRRVIHAIYGRSGIQTRYSVTPDLKQPERATLFRTDAQGLLIPPHTEERNRAYAQHSKELAVAVARELLMEVPKEEVTHVIFTSCTGFANPGADYHLIRELGLPEDVQRYTLGFMGCYAAFPSLRMASQFCHANPKALVLVICLELCTLHMQINEEPDSILANSLFADGAAAALVSAQEPQGPAYRLDGFESALLPSSEEEMAWEIGNQGFNIVLSSYVPEIIGSNIAGLLEKMLARQQSHPNQVKEWAVHPGGRAILDKVQESLGLAADALKASRAVLRDFGNMSSATILFVLSRMLENPVTTQASLCAMAFGPGLTVETALMERIGGFLG